MVQGFGIPSSCLIVFRLCDGLECFEDTLHGSALGIRRLHKSLPGHLYLWGYVFRPFPSPVVRRFPFPLPLPPKNTLSRSSSLYSARKLNLDLPLPLPFPFRLRNLRTFRTGLRMCLRQLDLAR